MDRCKIVESAKAIRWNRATNTYLNIKNNGGLMFYFAKSAIIMLILVKITVLIANNVNS